MLARLQQLSTLTILACAIAWLGWWWHDSVALALLGFVLVLMSYTLVLAFEFVALHSLNRGDPAGPATWSELARAWWGEIWSAPPVFCWRQPFRSNAVPDYLPRNGRRGVVFIHGFICNRGLWTPWMRRVRAMDHAFVAVSMEPVFGSIDDYVPTVEAAVQRVADATGQPPLVVCHSMGGLALRAWMRAVNDDSRVYRVLTIGSPHAGTWLGRFSNVRNAYQMRLGSQWLAELRGAEPVTRGQLFTCWYSNCDNIVFPATTATLAGADNRIIKGVAHVSLAFDAQVVDTSLQHLTSSDHRRPAP